MLSGVGGVQPFVPQPPVSSPQPPSFLSLLSQKVADKVFPYRVAVPQPGQGRNPADAGPRRQKV